jgi:hypothetical protein
MPPNPAAVKANKRRLETRHLVFKTIPVSEEWSRKGNKGFTTLPKPWPFIALVMDNLADEPCSKVYLDLWCLGWDSAFLEIGNENERAFACGWAGQRGVATWRQRIAHLQSLGFIHVEPGTKGSHHYILLVNPYLAIARQVEAKNPKLDPMLFRSLQEKCTEAGTDELRVILASLQQPTPPPSGTPIPGPASETKKKAAQTKK